MLAAIGACLGACSTPSLVEVDAARGRSPTASAAGNSGWVDRSPVRAAAAPAVVAAPPVSLPSSSLSSSSSDDRLPAAGPSRTVPAQNDALAPGHDVLVEIVATPVVFNFDRHELSQVRPSSLEQVDLLVSRLKGFHEAKISEIRLVGHADRLNATGQRDYNQRLSAKRVATVRQMLIDRGVDPALMKISFAGDTSQVKACQDKQLSRAELQECLLPNRRVEVHVISRR